LVNTVDLEKIETQLDIELPSVYKSLVLAFPIPACVGNTDTYLWDSADALIEENLALRAGRYGAEPWPKHAFCLGHAGGGDVYALDLRQIDAPVVWVDHGHYEAIEGYSTEPFSVWAQGYIRDLRHDLECDGVDPDSTPEDREAAETKNANAGCWTLVWLAVGGGILVAVVIVALRALD